MLVYMAGGRRIIAAQRELLIGEAVRANVAFYQLTSKDPILTGGRHYDSVSAIHERDGADLENGRGWRRIKRLCHPVTTMRGRKDAVNSAEPPGAGHLPELRRHSVITIPSPVQDPKHVTGGERADEELLQLAPDRPRKAGSDEPAIARSFWHARLVVPAIPGVACGATPGLPVQRFTIW